MTPQRMTVLASDRSNCLQAALASVLDRPINDVIDVTHPALVDDWFGNLCSWARNEGLDVEAFEPCDAPSGFSIALGTVERSAFPHVVVALDGRAVFDPYPGDEMLASVIAYITVRPAGPSDRGLIP